MPDDAIGFVRGAGLAHAECALVRMLAASEPGTTEQRIGSVEPAGQRAGRVEDRWQIVLRALSADQ